MQHDLERQPSKVPGIARVEEILAAAVEIESADERDGFVRQACDDDDELRQEVERLIANHLLAGEFLEVPVTGLAPIIRELPVAATQTGFKPGTMIGRYKLREVLGEGGMGTVYVAEQEQPVRRKVALKLIKLGMDSREVIARFEAERQALALMDHPNIARVLDAGMTNNGRPYFVMELVKGLPITEHCDVLKLETWQRLELFLQVCRAIQHAHQKGIIHRDLKPGNVLVAMHDTIPVVKVIDFGVAKAIGQSLSDQSVYTGVSQIVGTPLYMSPEQAGHSSLDVDTRSDVYSLGVLLYELLTGCTPFEREALKQVGHDEMRRIIREVDPPRPSTRISTLNAAALSTIAQCRQCEPHRLSQQLSGELDWIIMKAMEKDRQRRYESASHFADDLDRYLRDMPVEACPPSATYRLQKFSRRNRTTLIAAVLVSFSLIAGTGLSLWQALEATSARKLADERLINEQLASAEAAKHRRNAAENLEQALDAVDQMLTRVGDERLTALPGAEPVRRELYQDAIRFYEEFFRQAPNDPQLQFSNAKAKMRLGSMQNSLGDHYTAQVSREEAIRALDILLAQSPADQQIRVALAEACTEFGICEHWHHYRFPSAEKVLVRAIALWRELSNDYPDNLDYQWRVTQTAISLADNYKVTGRLELAEQTLRHSVDIQRQLWTRTPVSSRSHAALCESLFNLALLLSKDRKCDEETESHCREAIRRGEEVVAVAPEYPFGVTMLVSAHCLYGDFLKDRGHVAEAESHFRKAVDAGKELPRISPQNMHSGVWLPRALLALADLLARDGRDAEAIPFYLAAARGVQPAFLQPKRLGMTESIYKNATDGVLVSLSHLAQEGSLEQARQFCEELSKVSSTAKSAVLDRMLAARVWSTVGDTERSNQLLSEIMASAENPGSEAWTTAERDQYSRALFTWADREFHSGNFASALPVFDVVLRCNPNDSEALDHRGQILLTCGEPEKALADLDHALQQGRAYGVFTYGARARAHFRLRHYSRSLTDLNEAFQLKSTDAGVLSAIDPDEIAACPDEAFLRDYLVWFQQIAGTLKSSSQARVASAALNAALGQPEAACQDLTVVLSDTTASSQVLSQAALAALRIGDERQYRIFCRLLAACAVNKREAKDIHPIVSATFVTPHALDDYDPVVALAHRSVTLEPSAGRSLLNLGGILFRAGKLDEALVQLNAVASAPDVDEASRKCALYFLAMTHHHLGHSSEARQTYDQAVSATDQLLGDAPPHRAAPLSWIRRLTLERLRAEAATVLETSP